ncbi:AAA family ATPase [Catenulispora sp. NL8]|uniref:AAA family ATPase n=1 Tax=Catenulispora pinistramenti TaxID=2705254 RepID=A0ABS5KGT5_9ACTN|nr:AAA family ATPase [Catenulispora pinistramenti]MBS2545517.1 AAA family ATPase [Catenulispora pinistramenti]
MTNKSVPAGKTKAGKAKTGKTKTGKDKAVRGQLRAAAAAHLAAAPHDEHTVTQVAKTLDASGGAVGNALMALAAAGHARLTCEKPRRFRATDTTASAARFTVPVTAPKATPTAASQTPVPAPAAVTDAPAPAPTTSAATTGTPAGKPSGTPASTSAPVATVTAAEKQAGRKRDPKPVASLETAQPETAPSDAGPVIRPNGQAYHPRDLGGHRDVEVLRRLRDAGVAALLYGPPGTGKTSMVEAAFTDLITVAGDNDTTVADLVGEYTQNPDGTYEFVHGPLVVAMREGRALLIDDATLIPANVLAVLYPALDGRREIYIKAHKNEAVTAAPGFYVIAGHNPGAHGAVLTEALSSRFCFQVEVSSDLDLAKDLGIHPKAITVAKNLRRRVGTGDVSWCPNLRELLGFRTIAEVLGDEVAFANLIGIAPVEDREAVAEAVTTALGREVASLALGKRL